MVVLGPGCWPETDVAEAVGPVAVVGMFAVAAGEKPAAVEAVASGQADGVASQSPVGPRFNKRTLAS